MKILWRFGLENDPWHTRVSSFFELQTLKKKAWKRTGILHWALQPPFPLCANTRSHCYFDPDPILRMTRATQQKNSKAIWGSCAREKEVDFLTLLLLNGDASLRDSSLFPACFLWVPALWWHGSVSYRAWNNRLLWSKLLE